jgi:hypothetical protein
MNSVCKFLQSNLQSQSDGTSSAELRFPLHCIVPMECSNSQYEIPDIRKILVPASLHTNIIRRNLWHISGHYHDRLMNDLSLRLVYPLFWTVTAFSMFVSWYIGIIKAILLSFHSITKMVLFLFTNISSLYHLLKVLCHTGIGLPTFPTLIVPLVFCPAPLLHEHWRYLLARRQKPPNPHTLRPGRSSRESTILITKIWQDKGN